MKKILVFFLLIITPILVCGTQTESEIVWRTPDQTKIENLKESKQFRYTKTPPKEQSKSWSPNWNIDLTSVRDIFIILLVLSLILIFAFVMIRLRRPIDAGYQENDNFEITIETQEDFDIEIQNAILSTDYRRAIRLLYYKNLRALSDRLFIKMEKSKTNHAYIYEIEDGALRLEFVESTRIFDYVWYGEFPLSSQTFNQARISFDNLNNMITNAKP